MVSVLGLEFRVEGSESGVQSLRVKVQDIDF
jgi:hypothetical protein